jgi:hypothetical protein
MPELERYRECLRCGGRMEASPNQDKYACATCNNELTALQAIEADEEFIEETAPAYRLKGEYDPPPCILADHETEDGSIPDPCPACAQEAKLARLAADAKAARIAAGPPREPGALLATHAVNLPMSRKPDWYQGYDSWAARADGKFYVEDAPASMREPPKSDEEPKP